MPFCTHTVYLDGVKTRELKRRASTPDLTDFDKERIAENLDSEVADLVPELHRMSINVCAWPRNRVPYTVSTELQYGHPDIYKALTIALKAFREQIKSVKWVERKNEADFVKFVYDDECSSHVGCVGGQQEIKLTDWATPGDVLHEMGHAIGLHHEHSRIDRDHFVDVRIKEKDVNFDKEESGIPLGPYDYSSIMHYGAHAGSIIAHASKQSGQMGQRKEFSSLDVKGIDSIYGPLKCSFEQCGDVYWPQIWIECRTCWGDESNYGCCFVCALDCHSGHFLVSHQLSAEAMFVCDCGRNHHQKPVCTWHSTKTKNVKQPFYNCRDCFQNPNKSCCYQCMKTCHAGHHTSYAGIMIGYCDCGMKCCRIICKIPNPTCSDRCTYEIAGEIYHSQTWYECRTCWGGESNYGCCVSCAFNCHKGHVLVYRPAEEINAVCDCGRNCHQKAVCTWHSTKRKYVKQPFYRCYDCFTHPGAGCCYQCMQKCHAGHNTRFAGIMNAFCDCGLEHCRSSCLIPKPLTCTYESRGEDYHLQYWYHCYTCWGGESNYGCCSYCAFNCHKGHDLVYQPGKKVTAVCDCGRNDHQQAVCTWYSTRRKYVKQPFYLCFDCFTYIFRTPEDVFEGCCYQCMKKCHAGHNTAYAGILDAFCDCGLTSCRIRCSISSPK